MQGDRKSRQAQDVVLWPWQQLTETTGPSPGRMGRKASWAAMVTALPRGRRALAVTGGQRHQVTCAQQSQQGARSLSAWAGVNVPVRKSVFSYDIAP